MYSRTSKPAYKPKDQRDNHIIRQQRVRRWILDFPCTVCAVCAGDDKVTASEKCCFTCELYFCHSCFGEHRRNINLSDHVVVGTQSLVPKSGLVQIDLSRHGVSAISGMCCVFRGDSRYTIIADRNNDRVLVLDGSYDLASAYQCYSKPHSVCDLSHTSRIAVTMPSTNKLLLFKLIPGGKLVIDQTLTVPPSCRGVVSVHETFTDTLIAASGGKIKHEMEGAIGTINVLSLCEVSSNKYNLSRVKVFPANARTMDLVPRNIAVNNDMDRLFYTDASLGVVCLDTRGNTLYVFSSSILRGARGICVTPTNRIFVSGMESNNVVEFRAHGELVGEVVNKSHGIRCPITLLYDQDTHRLLIGCSGVSAPLKIVRL